jgi:hypothetical protein
MPPPPFTCAAEERVATVFPFQGDDVLAFGEQPPCSLGSVLQTVDPDTDTDVSGITCKVALNTDDAATLAVCQCSCEADADGSTTG